MHASILFSFAEFAKKRCSPSAVAALEQAIPPGTLVPFKLYPDALVLNAVAAVAEAERRSVPEVVEAYGEYFVVWAKPSYQGAFSAPNAKEFLKGIGRCHAVVRQLNPGAEPPEIVVEDAGPHELVVVYGSPRKLCPLVRGIVRGVASDYGESVAMTETHCMSRGDPRCRFQLRFV